MIKFRVGFVFSKKNNYDDKKNYNNIKTRNNYDRYK